MLPLTLARAQSLQASLVPQRELARLHHQSQTAVDVLLALLLLIHTATWHNDGENHRLADNSAGQRCRPQKIAGARGVRKRLVPARRTRTSAHHRPSTCCVPSGSGGKSKRKTDFSGGREQVPRARGGRCGLRPHGVQGSECTRRQYAASRALERADVQAHAHVPVAQPVARSAGLASVARCSSRLQTAPLMMLDSTHAAALPQSLNSFATGGMHRPCHDGGHSTPDSCALSPPPRAHPPPAWLAR
eukprot:359159-Chlamydomonas_euryale.AAC.34